MNSLNSSLNSSLLTQQLAHVIEAKSILNPIFLLVNLIGVLGNGIVLAIVRMKQQTDPSAVTVINIHLVSAWVVLDLIVLPVPVIINYLYDVGLRTGRGYCVYVVIMATLFSSARYWLEVALAVNRCWALCAPHYYSAIRRQHRRIATAMIAFAWTAATVFTVPYGLGLGGIFYTINNTNQCVYKTTTAGGEFLTVLNLYLPNVIVGVCCLAILIKLRMVWRTDRQTVPASGSAGSPAESQPVSQRRQINGQRRLNVAFVLFASYGWNLICDVPYSVISRAYSHLVLRHRYLSSVLLLLYALEFAMGPFTLLLVNREYWNIAKRQWPDIFCRNSGSTNDDPAEAVVCTNAIQRPPRTSLIVSHVEKHARS
ncbi:hypothetical protein BV898_08031 [Hypsibius exemplaris]|uniref:G-protein coupled receptors family 1 profile domain-containing protein n=1 Tax=Hypsibius exemplaris TaxID=2072580 RepID=A0A1W0WRT8_HYPEX|nr:hypothetical protein BV898_08031 [Hypsibius exemplaris]